MKTTFSILLSLFLTCSVFSQTIHPYVKLTEKIKGKRLELFAVNSGATSYNIFLRVETKDYRRSSSRPVLKTIPANSKVRLITMVKLNGKEGIYTTSFVVNEIAQGLSITKDHENFEVKFNNALHTKKITIYTKDTCDLCMDAKQLLDKHKIRYKELSIEKDSINLIQLISEFKKSDLKKKALVPILKIEDSLYTSLKTRQDFIKALKNHF